MDYLYNVEFDELKKKVEIAVGRFNKFYNKYDSYTYNSRQIKGD